MLRGNNLLIDLTNPRNVFAQAFQKKLLEKEHALLEDKCSQGHVFQDFIHKIEMKMFNIMSKNMAAEVNSIIHQSKGRKRDGANIKRNMSDVKIRKVTSN